MEVWELIARESIRDLVIRYNANADSGRFKEVLALFTNDACFELIEGDRSDLYRNHDGISRLLTDFQSTWVSSAAARGNSPYVRHFVATHQIDVEDRNRASGRSYVAVVKAGGLDHWGRYLDDYVRRDGAWLISRRRAITDGRTRVQPTR